MKVEGGPRPFWPCCKPRTAKMAVTHGSSHYTLTEDALASTMPRTVVLRHHLPDGTHHFDWLLEPADPPAPHAAERADDPNERVLIAWRLAAWPIPAGSSIAAERLPPHRRLYLNYEGPISGNRGTVQRIATGTATISADTPDRFEAVVISNGASCCLRAVLRSGKGWQLSHAPRSRAPR